MCGDPAGTVLRLIDADLRAHPEHVRPLDPDLLEQAAKLVEGMEIAVEGSGPEDDEPPLSRP